jgi:hypothetical protein
MNSTVAMAVPNVTCDMTGNPDIIGIGVTTLATFKLTWLQVRVSIFLPAITAAVLCAIIDFDTLDDLLFLLKPCMGISVTLIFAALIYQINNTVSQYHWYMIVHLGFMNSPAAYATWIRLLRAATAQPGRRPGFPWEQLTAII